MLIKSNLIKNLYKNVIKNEHLIFNAKKTWNSPVIRSRNIQTTPKLNAIHPLIWLIAKPLTKLGAIIAGRGFRKWWTALPKIKRDIFWQHFKRHQHKYGLIFGSSGLIMFTYYETHIQEAPFTHRKRFILFDNNHLEEIERIEQEQLFEMYESNFVNLYSPYSLRALRVANRLFSANKEVNEIANIDWKLVLIDADAINAIAFPNGTLVVFTGLLDFVENDDELATILAHEMAHAILQHAAEELSHTRLVDVISIALTLMLWAFLPTDLTAALCHFFAERLLKLSLELPYSRELEKEADKVGLILTARACFDIRYSPGFWKRMSTLEELNMPEILSTHPTNETRAQDLESMVPEGLILRKDCNCPDLAEFIEFNPVKHIPINVK